MNRELLVAFVTALISPIIVELSKAHPRLENYVTNINGIVAVIVSISAWLALEPDQPYWPWFLAATGGALLGAQRYEMEKRIRQAREFAQKAKGSFSLNPLSGGGGWRSDHPDQLGNAKLPQAGTDRTQP